MRHFVHGISFNFMFLFPEPPEQFESSGRPAAARPAPAGHFRPPRSDSVAVVRAGPCRPPAPAVHKLAIDGGTGCGTDFRTGGGIDGGSDGDRSRALVTGFGSAPAGAGTEPAADVRCGLRLLICENWKAL